MHTTNVLQWQFCMKLYIGIKESPWKKLYSCIINNYSFKYCSVIVRKAETDFLALEEEINWLEWIWKSIILNSGSFLKPNKNGHYTFNLNAECLSAKYLVVKSSREYIFYNEKNFYKFIKTFHLIFQTVLKIKRLVKRWLWWNKNIPKVA